jgi:hypothetical protein
MDQIMEQTKTRASSLSELEERLAAMFTKEEIGKGLAFQLRSTDVVITPYGKCGTTWLQQIVHTLRTRGDMDFDDISRVVPWIETSPALGIDLEAEQRANPRAFKSHLPYEAMPKGGKYINSTRHPGDALYAMYKFMEGWIVEPGAINLDDYARQRFMKSREYWQHLKSWWAQRHQPNVLFLAYEQMLADTEGTITRIAEFIGVPLDDDLMKLTLEHTSLSYMLEHKDRFDDLLMRKHSEIRCSLPEGGDASKVREGKSGGYKSVLSPEIIAELDEVWLEEIAEPLGFNDYEAMIATLKQ